MTSPSRPGIAIGGATVPVDIFKQLVAGGAVTAGLSRDFAIHDVRGPFDGKINSIYTFTARDAREQRELIFRARISEAFRYEHVVKEKILFPILDGTLDLAGSNLHGKIQQRVAMRTGSHVFSPTSPPVVPVQDLYYFDESREALPHMYTVMRYIDGISLFDHIARAGARGKPASDINAATVATLETAFSQAGEALGRLHGIVFPGFYPAITSIGDRAAEARWRDLFSSRVDALLAEATRHRQMRDTAPLLRAWIEQRLDLISNDEPAVLFHNDFQPQNFIIDTASGTIRGIIDFDNWGIAPREQDLVKMRYWGLRDLDPRFERAFMAGYTRHQRAGADFTEKVTLYTAAWFLLVYNFEMDKVAKQERNQVVDARFPAADVYLNEIRAIVNDER